MHFKGCPINFEPKCVAQHKCDRQEECTRHTLVLDLFLSRLEALRKMSVNQSRVKGNENVSILSRSSRTECEWLHSCVPCLVHISPKVSESAFNKSRNPAVESSDRPLSANCLYLQIEEEGGTRVNNTCTQGSP